MLDKFKIKNILKKTEYFYNGSDYDNALIFCNKALNLDSRNIYALYVKSRIMYIQSHYDLSLELLDEILKIEENHDKALLLKGRICLELNYSKQGFECYANFLNNNTDFNLFFNEITYFSFSDDNSKKKLALDLCNLYLEKYDSYEINVWKSQLLYRLNLLEDALFGLNNLINIKGDDEYLYSIKTQVLIKLGKYEDALTLADYSFKLYHNYGFLYDKAESLFALGDYESSKEICNEILGSQNRIYDNSAKFLIAKIYFAEKDYDKSLMEINDAIILLRNIVDEDSQSDEYGSSFNQYYFFKAEILFKLNELDKSDEIMDCLIEKEEDAKYYCLKAKILYEMNDYEASLKFVDKTLDLDSNCSHAKSLKKQIEKQI